MIIEKYLVSLQPFVIPIKGLKAGRNDFEWNVGKEFFESFESTEVLDAELFVEVSVECDGDSIELECAIDGSVTVTCDRCLEPLKLPVSTEFELGDDELDPVRDIDLRQDVYDFVMIALPMQRVHPEGGCNGETLKYLSK